MLWSRSFTPAASQLASSAASPVNSLIRDALIEGKTAEDHYERDGYAVRWTFFNELELIFVVRPIKPRPISWPIAFTRFLVTGCISAYSAAGLRRRPPYSSQVCFREVVRAISTVIRHIVTRYQRWQGWTCGNFYVMGFRASF